MQAAFDIYPMVKKYSGVSFAQLQVVRDIANFHLADIAHGVVFVFAAWSGQAIVGLQRLTSLLSAHPLDLLDVHVLDIECMTCQDMTRIFGRVFHGCGEALWIRDGKIIAQLETFAPESEPLILTFTKQLLGERVGPR